VAEEVGRFDSQTKLLIERLAQAEFDLETALAGSVDSVTHPGGHTYLLRAAQQALLRSEELANEQAALLRTIVESAPDLVAYVGIDWRLRYLNRSARNDETVGQDWLALQLPEDQAGLRLAFDHVVATGATATFEGPGLAPDGTTVCYARRFGAVVQEGQVVGVIIVSRDVTLQRAEHEAVRRSAASLSMAARVGRLGGWELELSPLKLMWSDEVRAIHEVPPDYIPNLEHAVAFYPPESMPTITRAVEACMRDGTPFDADLEIVTAKGRRIWVRSIGEAERDANGVIQRIHGAFQDISQARQAADALRVSEERFRLLARATNDTVWDCDMVTGALWWNEGVETLFGYALGGMPSSAEFRRERIHPEDRQAVNARVQEAIDHGEENWWGEYRFRRSDGTYTPVVERGHIMRDEAGRVIRMIGGMTDLTERKAIAARVANQAVLLDAASDAIYQMDLDGRILSWNRSADAIYGWAVSDALGNPSRDLLHALPSEFDQARLLVLRDEQWRGELRQRTKAGLALIVEARWTLVRDDYKKPVSILSINTDITERKKLEAQFLRAQRMESVGTLAGGIAHDLNNILAPILMAVASLQQDATTDEAREVLETLRSCSQRGADLVRQVLSFARGVEGDRLLVQPSHLMHDIEQIIRQTFPKNIDFRLSHPRSLWAVEGDPTQLHQVFMNLCVNARDAMPKGGTLTVTMKNVVLDATYAGMSPEAKAGNYVVINVADTGHGIAPDVREKIFEPFFTTKEVGKGTGLGLSTTATIVRSHGGFITVYSEVGRGSAFGVYLLAADSRSVSRPPHLNVDTTQLPRGKGELILVVDDEAAIRQITKSTLESFGYSVLLADDGAQAIGIFAQHRGDIALVLTDMMMPIMDGPTLIFALQRIDPRVRVIAASGLHSGADVARAALAGVVHFLAKPYTAEAMLMLFKTVLTEEPRN
jgi:PAS domain S-box-containing protein